MIEAHIVETTSIQRWLNRLSESGNPYVDWAIIYLRNSKCIGIEGEIGESRFKAPFILLLMI